MLKANVKRQTLVQELVRRAIRAHRLRVGIGLGAVLFDAVLNEVVQDLLVLKRPVRIPGFGSFSISTTRARRIQNPKTKQPMALPPSWRVHFKPAPALRGPGGAP